MHWAFVREVASDMEALGYELGEEERCWVLRGLVASASTGVIFHRVPFL